MAPTFFQRISGDFRQPTAKSEFLPMCIQVVERHASLKFARILIDKHHRLNAS
jgi:hypothetical protein